VCDLPGRMHAGVGAARAGDFDGLVSDLGDGFLDALLHADAGTLALPAVVRGAVVLYANCDAQSGR